LVLDEPLLPAFASAHENSRLPGTLLATCALSVRSHWLRLPASLLLRHLIHKAWQANMTARLAAQKSPTGL